MENHACFISSFSNLLLSILLFGTPKCHSSPGERMATVSCILWFSKTYRLRHTKQAWVEKFTPDSLLGHHGNHKQVSLKSPKSVCGALTLVSFH